MALTWSWSVLALVVAVEPRRRWLGLVGFAAAHQWNLYMGFFSFYVAQAAALALVALALRLDLTREGSRAAVTLALALLVIAMLHVFVAVLAGAVLVAIVLARDGVPFARRARAAATVVAPAALLSVVVSVGVRAAHARSSPTTWLPLAERVTQLGDRFAFGPAWRQWPLPLLALVALAVLWRRRRQEDRRLLALGACSLALLALTLVVPYHVQSWECVSTRLVAMGVTLGVVLLPIERLPRPARLVASLAVLLFATASIAWGYALHRELRASLDDALSGLAAPIRRAGYRLPVILSTAPQAAAPGRRARSVKALEAARHVANLYVLEQGGMTPYLFVGYPLVMPFAWRERPRIPRVPDQDLWANFRGGPFADPRARAAALDDMASAGAWYDDVIYYGPAAGARFFLARGFVADWRRGQLMIARFVGCPARMVVPPREADRDIVLEYGWHPAEGRVWHVRIPQEATRGAPTTVPLAQSPCGPIWLRAFADRDGSSRWTAGEPLCLPELEPPEPSVGERAVVTLRPGQPDLACRWR